MNAIPVNQFNAMPDNVVPVDKFNEADPRQFDHSSISAFISSNLKSFFETPKLKTTDEQAPNSLPGDPPVSLETATTREGKPVTKAADFIDAIEAGLQMSVGSLAIRGQPTTILPEHAPLYMQIAEQLGEVVPDLPIMALGGLAGGIMGGAAGTAIAPGPGTIAGATLGTGGGAMALPSAMRQWLVDGYQQGSIRNWEDLWSRVSSSMISGVKGFAVGAATAGAGAAAGKLMTNVGTPLVKSLATVSSEIATMTTVGKALEGQVPTFDDFANASVLVGAFHLTGFTTGKLLDIYAKTGIKPEQVAQHAEQNTTLKQDLLSENKELPTAYENYVEKPNPLKSVDVPLDAQTNPNFGAEAVRVAKPDTVDELFNKLPGALGEGPLDVFHGTNTEFEKFDFNKSGGVVHFTPDSGTARNYAADIGSSGRKRLKKDEVKAFVYGQKLVEGKPESEESYYTYNKETKNWTDEFGRTRTSDEMRDLEHLANGRDFESDLTYEELGAEGASFEAKNQKIIKQSIDKSRILDVTTPDGAEVLANAAKEVNNPHLTGLTNPDSAPGRLWSFTKYAAQVEPRRKALKALVNNLKEKGYEGVHFNDDMHKTVAIFDPEKLAPKTEESTAVPPKSDTSPEAAMARIQEKLGTKQTISKLDQAKSAVRDLAKNAYTNVVDKYDPIKQAVRSLADGRPVKETFDAYVLARMSNDAKAKASEFLDYKTFDLKGKYNGEGLAKLVEPFKEDLGGLNAYLAARRAVELTKLGIEKTGFNAADAEAVVKKFGPKYEEAAKKITDYNNRLLKYATDAGLLSEEAYKSLVEKHQQYVPFRRLYEDEFPVGGPNKSAPIKNIRGVKSEDTQTLNPIESITDNTLMLLQLAERNRALEAIVKQAESSPDQRLIIEKKDKYSAVKFKSPELLSFLNEHGFDPGTLDVVGFAKRNANLKENEFEAFIDGQRKIFSTTKELATALKAIDGDARAQSLIFQLARGVASTLRLSIGVTPDFILRNFFRDQITRSAYTKYGSGVVDTLSAIGDLMDKKNSQAYHEWMKSGGAGGAFMDLNETYLKRDILKLVQETGMIETAWNSIYNPVQMMKAASNIAEQATRLAEFKKVTQGDYSQENLLKGGFAAREVTVDFQRIGAKMSALNSITAFQNASIQGIDRMARAFKDNPSSIAINSAYLITAPSVLLWWANKDDSRYQDAPQWQKDLFWIIPTDNWIRPEVNDDIAAYPADLVKTVNGEVFINKGVTYRFPKPQELGLLFGSLPERVLDAWHQKNPMAMEHFMESLGKQFTPSVIPTVATPFVETWANKSLFTGNAIVSDAVQNLLPEYRYTDYTSETAKKLSSLIAQVPGAKHMDIVAPAVLDNWITAWSGNMGKYAVQTVDASLRAAGVSTDIPPEKTLADVPFVQAFIVRNPSSGLQPIQDFYDKKNKYDQMIKSVSVLEKRGNIDEAKKEAEKIPPEAYDYVETGKAISQMRHTLHAINRDPSLSPAEKRQQIDGLYYMINNMAKSQLKR